MSVSSRTLDTLSTISASSRTLDITSPKSTSSRASENTGKHASFIINVVELGDPAFDDLVWPTVMAGFPHLMWFASGHLHELTTGPRSPGCSRNKTYTPPNDCKMLLNIDHDIVWFRRPEGSNQNTRSLWDLGYVARHAFKRLMIELHYLPHIKEIHHSSDCDELYVVAGNWDGRMFPVGTTFVEHQHCWDDSDCYCAALCYYDICGAAPFAQCDSFCSTRKFASWTMTVPAAMQHSRTFNEFAASGLPIFRLIRQKLESTSAT